MNRPFKNLKANELIEKFKKIKNDTDELKLFIEEISNYRKKSFNKLKPTLDKANEILSGSAKKIYEDKDRIKNIEKHVQDLVESVIESNISENTDIKRKSRNNLNADYSDLIKKKYDNFSNYQFSNKIENEVKVKAFFLFKFFGAKDYFFSNDNLEITWKFKKTTKSMPFKDINSIKSKKGFFFNDLIISDGNNYVNLERLTASQLKYFEAKIQLVVNQSKIIYALQVYQSFQNADFYINQKKIDSWLEEFQDIQTLITSTDNNNYSYSELEKEFISIFENLLDNINKKNSLFIKHEKEIFKPLFDGLEENPLTENQREAIINDNDSSLIVAGAGTGKTSTVMGKIAYLLKRKIVNENEILALAYGKDAAQEMRDRLSELLNVDVQISTFHALGLKIVQEMEGVKIKISDSAIHERQFHALIANFLNEISEDSEYSSLVLNFISFHRYPVKYLEDFNSKADYFKYLRKIEPETLLGEKVKSFEELLIADWLALNGVEYIYEHPYEIQTGNLKRNQYRPDFYIVEKGIYLEHFGIGRDGSTAPGINSEKYNESIDWKRKLHRDNGTKLIETFSYERQEGSILNNLENRLRNEGVNIDPENPQIKEKIMGMRDINKRLVSLLKSFLSVYKEAQYTKDETETYLSSLKTNSERDRYRSFLKLFYEVFERYEDYLDKMQEKDFADLIVMATDIIKQGNKKLKFRRVIVDEYQDIARGRFRLIKAIVDSQNDCRIMCVGDDWQSIYGFSGSDIKMTLNFEDLFGKASRIDLDRSFRFTYPILNTSSLFIQKNPNQLNKNIEARQNPLDKAVEICSPSVGEELDLQEILAKINSQRPKKKKWQVLILARYNHVLDKIAEDHTNAIAKFPNLEVQFMTIHKSKGLGADAVAVIGLVASKWGFPGYIETDPIMNMVLKGEDDFLNSEERRVLYVAMTRAKEKLLLCTSNHNQSEFIHELKESEYEDVYYDTPSIVSSMLNCPECMDGKLWLKYPNRINGYAWVCNLSPYCEGKAKYCQKCNKLPTLSGSTCSDPKCYSSH